ncbi:MAG: hypothetical protein U0324_28950 [Polyangiales bacterium]
MRWARALLLPLAACLAQCAKDPTGLFVSITVDSALADNVNFAVIRVFDASTSATSMEPHIAERTFAITPGQTYTLFVEKTGTRSRVRLELDAVRVTPGGGGGGLQLPMPGMGVVNDRAVVSYAEDKVLKVPMGLYNACRSGVLRMPCPANNRCTSNGTCTMFEVSNPAQYNW